MIYSILSSLQRILSMKIFEEIYKDIEPGYPLEVFAPINRILFIDIETTGLSREKTDLYLIGCGFFDEGGYHTIQWFADSPEDEPAILSFFSSFIKDRFTLLIHYNGDRFDIPYLKYKSAKHGLEDPFASLENYDIYSEVKPLKKLLGLYSLRQRCIEAFLDINSDDPYTGRDLIRVYHDYVRRPSEALLRPLIYHNSEDLKGMAYILPILHYTQLSAADLLYVSYSIHAFNDYSGNEHREILAEYTHDSEIPKSFTVRFGETALSLRSNKTALLRIPIFEGTLKHFYDNYRDYYYLPAEDCCIHKAVAAGEDRSLREDSKKETC